MTSSFHNRKVCFIVLNNGVAGAFKQAHAMGSRLQQELDKSKVSSYIASCSTKYAEKSKSKLLSLHYYANKLPPFIHTAVSKYLFRDPYWGYSSSTRKCIKDITREHKSALYVLVGCGRSTVTLSAALRHQKSLLGCIFNVHIQHPRTPLSEFDAVIAPRHDFTRTNYANNLYLSSGSIVPPKILGTNHEQSAYNSVGQDQMDQNDTKEHSFSYIFSKISLSGIKVVWLIGGPCRGFRFSKHQTKDMISTVLKSLHNCNCTLLVSFSRRTPTQVKEMIYTSLTEAFKDNSDHLFLYDPTSNHSKQNPYTTMLSIANAILTTPDSISMTTEAISSGKKVFVLNTDNCTGKFAKFHQYFINLKWVYPYQSTSLESQLLHADSMHAAKELENELDQITTSITQRILTKL